MSLFDDLLTKPVKSNPTASAGGSEQQDSIIVTDSPIIISESSPIATSVEVREPVVTIPEPTAAEDLSNSSIIIQEDIMEQAPIEPIAVEESKIGIEPVVNTISFMEDEKTEDAPGEKTEKIDEVSFFGMNLGEDTPEEAQKSIEKTEDTPRSFKEYIQNAITNATTLLQNLGKKDAETLEKEHEYEEQKKHFDTLAREEEEMHQKILAEKEQAEKMLAYLETEKNKAEGTRKTKKEDDNEEANVMEEAIVEKLAEQKPKESKKKTVSPANDEIFDLSA